MYAYIYTNTCSHIPYIHVHKPFIRDMTHLYVTWLIHMWHNSFDVTWIIYMWHDSSLRDVTHSNMTWLIQCDMTYSYVTCLTHKWHAPFMCDMTHFYVTWLNHTWHEISGYLRMSHVTFERAMSHIEWILMLRTGSRVVSHRMSSRVTYENTDESWHIEWLLMLLMRFQVRCAT